MVTATDGDENATLSGCQNQAGLSGLKLYRGDNQTGGGPVNCGLDDTSLEGQSWHEFSGSKWPWMGFWDFSNLARSGSFLNSRTNEVIICLYYGGSYNGTRITRIADAKEHGWSDWVYTDFNLPDDEIQSVAFDHDYSGGASDC